MNRGHRAAAVLAGGLILAGCTGVPTSSAPQSVQPVNVAVQPTEDAVRPTKGAFPNDIVTEFLRANTMEPGKHTSARTFLTNAARSRWRDDQVTIISDQIVGTYDKATGKVTVTGRPFGTLDKDGIFRLPPPGTSSRASFEFRLVRDRGQYRITELTPGLLITADEFTESYNRERLFFFDNANQYLVQDPRYTDIVDRTALASWLLDRLAGGPREELQDSVTADTLPAQTDPTRMTVEIDATTRVEIPGSRQLDAGGRERLAAQLSQTLDDATSGNGITITDGGHAVSIPAVGGTVFHRADFDFALGPPAPAPDLFYLLSDGSVVNSAGKALEGTLGRPTYGLTSVALSRPSPTGPLLVAGVRGLGDQAQLLTGSQSGGLRPIDARRPWTRPAFASGRREVWVGAGPTIYRITLSPTGIPTRIDKVPFAQPSTARVRALRVSPDGSRIAVVLGGRAPAGGQLFVGAIVRGNDQVRIDTLSLISPPGVTIVDVAWLNPLRLFAVGSDAGTLDPSTFDTYLDGTQWTSADVRLSSRPDSVTVTTGAHAWVSAGGFVWEQSTGGWLSPSGGQTPGTAPIYLQ